MRGTSFSAANFVTYSGGCTAPPSQIPTTSWPRSRSMGIQFCGCDVSRSTMPIFIGTPFTHNLHPIPDVYVEAHAAWADQVGIDRVSVCPDDWVLAPGGGELGFQGERLAGDSFGQVAD